MIWIRHYEERRASNPPSRFSFCTPDKACESGTDGHLILMMHTARGFVECDGGRFIGTFDIGGSPRYVAVDVKPLDLSFECKSATLTYGDVTQLDGNYNWAGTAGRDVLEMAFVGGVAIVGPLTTPRSSIRIRGAGSWSTAKPDLLPLPASSNALNVPGNFQSHNTVRDAAKDAREQQLIDLGLPIIVYATACVSLYCGSIVSPQHLWGVWRWQVNSTFEHGVTNWCATAANSFAVVS